MVSTRTDFITYPSYDQIPVCQRGKHHGIKLETEIWDKGSFRWSPITDSKLSWAEWTLEGMDLDLTSNEIRTQNNKFRITVNLEDYKYERNPTQ